MNLLHPNYINHEAIKDAIDEKGYCVINASNVCEWANCSLNELQVLSSHWHDMPHDSYLKDGGRYRRRLHSCFEYENEKLSQVPHRAHWQPLDFNALHGGMERWFSPLHEHTVASTAWSRLLTAFARTASDVRGGHPMKWCIEAHQFRIDTTDGIGRPTPEGAHRDGVDFVAVFMIARSSIKGGETRVFEANAPYGERFTLSEPWSLLLLDDNRVIHESTPIQPLEEGGYRDTLVLTCRENVFQDPPT